MDVSRYLYTVYGAGFGMIVYISNQLAQAGTSPAGEMIRKGYFTISLTNNIYNPINV